MRWFLSLMLLMVVGCSDPPPEVLTDSIWQVECPFGTACQPFPDSHEEIHQFNGAPGESGEIVNARCSSTRDQSAGFSNLLLEVSEGDETGFIVRNLRLDTASGQVIESPACEVSVTDMSFEYEGACGVEAPSTEQPCQITSVDVEGTQVTARVKCEDLASRQNASVIRDVLGYDKQTQSSTDTARLLFQNCTGL